MKMEELGLLGPDQHEMAPRIGSDPLVDPAEDDDPAGREHGLDEPVLVFLVDPGVADREEQERVAAVGPPGDDPGTKRGGCGRREEVGNDQVEGDDGDVGQEGLVDTVEDLIAIA
jgi:hypothetical protein